MKTKRFTTFDLPLKRRSSGHESALTISRIGHPLTSTAEPLQPSAGCNRQSQHGVALIITLILLAVTLVMAVAFLAVSRRERNSVSGTEDAAAAKYAMNAGQHNAEARIVTQILMTTNPYVFSLLVSTNYVNRYGFNADEDNNLTNVNYDYYGPPKSGPLSAVDLEYNIANLYYNPRPPVFYGSNDFRFYLDLNRNGMYDTNGWVTDFNNQGTTNGLGTVSFEVGDPEWIGVLAHPDQPHSANNPFIARYCFIAVPANSFDLNYIHNQALDATAAFGGGNTAVNPNTPNEDAYWRDQGVGTWEINLAAFLTDLNSNYWDPASEPYLFPEGAANTSVAFDDARALVAWRYHNYYPWLDSADTLYGGSVGWFGVPVNNLPFNNGADYYGIGRQYTFDTNFNGYAGLALPWVGAPQTNEFFSSPSELFNVSQSDLDFVTNLYSAGTNTSTYNRYTFYRLLAQLGTDTKPAQGKVNLNYQNVLVDYDTTPLAVANNGPAYTNIAQAIAIVPNMETNFLAWNPHDFFTVAANQLLKEYTTEWFEASPSNYMQTYYGYYGNNILAPVSGFISFTNLDGLNVTNVQFLGQTNQIPSFGLTNIPVYMNGSFVYSPAVNRILQLAANIYDATTNTSTFVNSNYPSVFRPVFFKTNEYNAFLGEYFTNVYIRGYQYVPQPYNVTVSGLIFNPPVELADLPFGYSTTNVWGVPWIIGAKKGLPNFNGFELVSTFFVERELQFTRTDITPQPQTSYNPSERNYTTNQQYVVGISNAFAMSDWNSYANQYNNQVTIYGQDQLSVALTNSDNVTINNPFLTNVWNYSTFTPGLQVQPWPGRSLGQSFVLPFGTNTAVMQNLSYPPSPASTNNLYTYLKTPGKSATYAGVTFTGPCFIPNSLDPDNYLDAGTPPMPQSGLMETNHLQVYMLDTDPNHRGGIYILDYIQLGSMNNNVNINAVIADSDSGGLWSTNLYSGSVIPWGVVNQVNTSLQGGTVPGEDADGGGAGGTWARTTVPGVGNDVSSGAQQAYCSAFFAAGDYAMYNGIPVTNLLYHYQAPFTAMRQIVQRYVLEANDPLVHYLSSDLNDFPDDSTNRVGISSPNVTCVEYVKGQTSDRYMPWGISGNFAKVTLNNLPPDSNPENLSYKDPLVTAGDYWDFPSYKYPTVGWLGRVHRGTPWQTVYMKSPDILQQTQAAGNQTLQVGVPTWQLWTGNLLNSYDAENSAPDQDRLLFDLFMAAPDDDATRGQLSVNIGADDPNNDPLDGLASWSALLSGVLTLTNNRPDQTMSFGTPNPPSSSAWNIQPLGTVPYPGGNMTNSAMWQIVQGINSARTNYGVFPNPDGLRGVFEHEGDIFRVPQLSVASPLLNDDAQQQPAGISDEMYEWLPQQMLGLVTASGTQQNPPRYVIYCYGQALKPAVNGIVTSGTFNGLCTNYQVVAESASRVLIRVDNTPTPANPTATPHVVVEQYNTLPPN